MGKIAVDLNYSWKQIHRLHNKALNIIVNKMRNQKGKEGKMKRRKEWI